MALLRQGGYTVASSNIHTRYLWCGVGSCIGGNGLCFCSNGRRNNLSCVYYPLRLIRGIVVGSSDGSEVLVVPRRFSRNQCSVLYKQVRLFTGSLVC